MPFRLDFEDDPEDNVSRTFECVSIRPNVNEIKGCSVTPKFSDVLYIDSCKHCILKLFQCKAPMRTGNTRTLPSNPQLSSDRGHLLELLAAALLGDMWFSECEMLQTKIAP